MPYKNFASPIQSPFYMNNEQNYLMQYGQGKYYQQCWMRQPPTQMQGPFLQMNSLTSQEIAHGKGSPYEMGAPRYLQAQPFYYPSFHNATVPPPNRLNESVAIKELYERHETHTNVTQEKK